MQALRDWLPTIFAVLAAASSYGGMRVMVAEIARRMEALETRLSLNEGRLNEYATQLAFLQGTLVGKRHTAASGAEG